MQLNGKQIKQVQDALLAAFDKDTLPQMLRVELDTVLAHVADGDNLSRVIVNLVSWAEQQGRIEDLIQGAYTANSSNVQLQQLWTDSRAWSTNKGGVPPLDLIDPLIDKAVSQAPPDRLQSVGEVQEAVASLLHPPERDQDRERFYWSLDQAHAFDERIRSALPRSRRDQYYQAQNAIEINRVLEKLADKPESYGLFWTRGMEHNPADTFQQISHSIWLIGALECDIKDLWVYRHHK